MMILRERLLRPGGGGLPKTFVLGLFLILLLCLSNIQNGNHIMSSYLQPVVTTMTTEITAPTTSSSSESSSSVPLPQEQVQPQQIETSLSSSPSQQNETTTTTIITSSIETNLTTTTTFNRTGPIIRSQQQQQSSHQVLKILLDPEDDIYKLKDWDVSPIVIEQYKLVFFSIPKVACTTWKQALRRMMGYTNWKSQVGGKLMLPHNPKTNGLTYLHHYSVDMANDIMTNPNWTRAIFIRDPKLRFLSAFLDKAKRNSGKHVIDRCCRTTKNCIHSETITTEEFLKLIQICKDSHWDLQSNRLGNEKYWSYINFIGHFETAQEDSYELLQRIGAWDEIGKTGWGINGTERIFEKSKTSVVPINQNHVTNSQSKIWQYFTPSLERQLEEFYAKDYNMLLFNFTKTNLTTS